MSRKPSFVIFALLILLMPALVAGDQVSSADRELRTRESPVGMGNPAAVYCQELGYEYQIVQDEDGEHGVCQLPDATVCGDWDFLEGSCGQDYSYCGLQGYDTVTRGDSSSGFGSRSAVCVDREGQEIGSAVELFDLQEKSQGCGVGPDQAAVRETLTQSNTEAAPLDTVVPAAFDWRNYQGANWLTPVRNQALCGSCWAFSAVAVAEAAYNISRDDPNFDLNLSEQYLVSDCHQVGGYQNCCGGWKDVALWFIETNGVPDDSCMPYVDGTSAYDGSSCTFKSSSPCICVGCAYSTAGECSDQRCTDACPDVDNRKVYLRNYGYLGYEATNAAMKQYLVEYGPLAVSVGIGSSVGGGFGRGILPPDVYSCSNDSVTNHGVVLVGYSDSGGYWIIRNSWGNWNGDGYYKLAYNECGVNQTPFYAQAGVFPDIVNTYWAIDWIETIFKAGLTSGYPDGTYRPENNVTRAEMAVFLLNALNISPATPSGPEDPFSDISGHWAESFILELENQGITGGYPDGTYRPDDLVTRAEMAVFLLNASAATVPPLDGSHPFSDISSHWGEAFIEELYDQGVTGGYPDGTYRPNENANRAEMAVFLVNTFQITVP